MTKDEIAKNLLLNHTCDNCSRRVVDGETLRSSNMCLRWLGESVGWQHWNISKNNTCKDWK